jgi:predicted ribosome quality control (RQC) complex YloA/Tae2 family protein
VSRAGERILVGRGGVDNHALTFRVARGNDMWLHVRDSPGAHVVVPQPARGREPHPETLLDAAALAVHHSDLRGEPAAEVTLTQRKHVRAITGGPPGRVTVAGGRTLTVTDVPARVERLYLAVAQGEVPE